MLDVSPTVFRRKIARGIKRRKTSLENGAKRCSFMSLLPPPFEFLSKIELEVGIGTSFRCAQPNYRTV